MSQPSLMMRNLRRYGQKLLHGAEQRLPFSSLSCTSQGCHWQPQHLPNGNKQTTDFYLRVGNPRYVLNSVRFFQSESQYHSIADETLEEIQDAVEMALEEKEIPEFEVTLASGVLTMSLPPHGTWVLNKQTPNQQIWWSSPLSGPRRYEYEDDEWVFTRDDTHSMTLTQALKEEIWKIYDIELDL